MNIEEFVDKYKPIRNKFELTSPLSNMMYEGSEEEQLDFVESSGDKNIWSYNPSNNTLINGIYYNQKYIGYIVCKISCDEKRGTIIVKM